MAKCQTNNAADMAKQMLNRLVRNFEENEIHYSIETDSIESLNSFLEDGNYRNVYTGNEVTLFGRINEVLIKNTTIFDKTVILFSDVPDLDSKVIDEALEQLNNNDIVIGPDDGGGMYLLGMKKFCKIVDDSLKGEYFKVIIDKLNAIKVYVLPELYDVDVQSDLIK